MLPGKLVKFELNSAGVGELLKSQEVADFLLEMAAARCPEGCEVSTATGSQRTNARISAVTEDAVQDNLENNTLLAVIS